MCSRVFVFLCNSYHCAIFNRYMTELRCKYNYYFSFIAYPEDKFSKNLTFCLGTKFAMLRMSLCEVIRRFRQDILYRIKK